jgi:mRNA interferase MazF
MTKFRPAVVLAEAGRGDWVLCQITSNPYSDPRAVRIETADFASGSLRLTSYARPAKLFTANAGLIAHQVGRLDSIPFRRLIEAVLGVFRTTTY